MFYNFLAFLPSLNFLVHRIRCRSPTFGAKCCTSWFTCCWHEWLKCRWMRGKSFPSSCAIKAHIQNEEGVGANEVGQFFVTGATDAAGKPSHFYCRVCRKDVSVLTHGPHEILRHYQGVKHFARDQRLRLETPGWMVLDFEGNPLSESELERRREHILRGPLVVRDREYLCRGFNYRWVWSTWCDIASCCEGVVANWDSAIRRFMRAGEPVVVAVHADC